ncbi:MAG: glycosyltransferase family 4 protein [Myxococcota bacterium]|nr:glycosyltransferase family 4 protein [Myxococcota bacterium]
MLGNHVPRQCGIATFTTDLSDAIASEFPEIDCFVVAMNDAGRHHLYPPRVRFEIAQGDLTSYRRAADFLNVNPVDVVCVQHEYGIFGGKAGSHVLALLRELRMPVVSTLHTILAEPNATQRAAMDELTSISERLVVMSQQGASLIREVHGVPLEKIDVIPHGIPAVPAIRLDKRQLGVQGRRVILTFGLLSPDKGIENVIEAMPAILARYPDTVYIVLGATHPHVREEYGETYRLSLEARAKKLGVDSSMIFHNRFVSQAELVGFLSAADIYVTPYLRPQQITSGTLAYAVGSGKAVISTPYWYATELLADGRGILVPWRDPPAIAREVIGLFDAPEKAQALRDRAAEYGRSMVWPAVARRYAESFEQARVGHASRLRTVFLAKTLAMRPSELPEMRLAHLRAMTDDTGILQHATFNVPRCDDGYCLDDNARALLLVTLIEDAGVENADVLRALASRYAAFVSHAFNAEHGRFRNFMSYSRRWAEERGSEDSHGRALWALGTVVGRSRDPGKQSLAGELFQRALPAVERFTSPRAWAYTLLGIEEYLRAFEGDRGVEAACKSISQRLLFRYDESRAHAWPWYEDRVTYCNARLPQALLVAGARMGNEAMTTAGQRSLQWLAAIQCSEDGFFSPIGSNGFYPRGGSKAAFDQQPVEACAMVSACLEAQRVTGNPAWADHSRRAFAWFLGQNQLQQSLYDPRTGGCRDGLHSDRLNENQGAESTLSFLLALLEMRLVDRAGAVESRAREATP